MESRKSHFPRVMSYQFKKRVRPATAIKNVQDLLTSLFLRQIKKLFGLFRNGYSSLKYELRIGKLPVLIMILSRVL